MNEHKRVFWTAKNMFRLGMLVTIPFILLAVMSFFDWGLVAELDDVVGRGFHDSRREWLTWFFVGITRLGDTWFVTLLTTVIFFYLFLKHSSLRLAIWYAATVALGAGVLNQVVKYIFQRPRPSNVEHLINQGGYSFPSGHAMGSLITYGAIIFLVVRLSKNTLLNWIVGILLALLIGFIGISRVYVGVHYPSDIIGGYSLGAAWLAFSIGMYGLALTKQGEE